MKTYLIVNTFWHKGQMVVPAAAGEPAQTIDMSERDARYPLLAGDIAELPAAVEPPSNAG